MSLINFPQEKLTGNLVILMTAQNPKSKPRRFLVFNNSQISQAQINRLKAEINQLRTSLREIINTAYQAINEPKKEESSDKLKNSTSVQLLQELGQRIARGEISKTYFKGFPYLLIMIKTFADKHTEALFNDKLVLKWRHIEKVARKKLDQLNKVKTLLELTFPLPEIA